MSVNTKRIPVAELKVGHVIRWYDGVHYTVDGIVRQASQTVVRYSWHGRVQTDELRYDNCESVTVFDWND